ncbi:MAG: TIGR00159 family protein [Candidatus Omnitrophica bacterium]|nr:TIGR00159 family protein [Candidatus Omnitrophota bacterium]
MQSLTVLIIKFITEISILWFCYYVLMLYIKGTRTLQVLKGISIVILLFIITKWLRLDTITWIMTKMLPISILALVIIFQPELRRGLARLGQFGVFPAQEMIIDEITKSATTLSKKKIGALMAIEREIGLRPYVESGVSLDSKVTSELINTIFMPNTPLHDGGIVIEEDRIVAAGCLFPLTQEAHITKTLGTRHRAAIGLSEETDAIVVVVSEETGNISIAISGKLTRDLNREDLIKSLGNLYRPKRRKNILDFLKKVSKESSEK